MTDHSDLIDRLRAACVGYPRASIAWPHRILHEAADALSSQSLSLSEAREDRDSWRRVAERCESEKQAAQATIKRMDRAASEANALYLKMSVERDALKGTLDLARRRLKEISTGAAYQPRIHAGAGVIEIDAALNAPSALENGPAGLADATNDPAESDLSSLRAGAPCPHAPTYDAGLCCGHPDDCTFVSPSNLSKEENDA